MQLINICRKMPNGCRLGFVGDGVLEGEYLIFSRFHPRLYVEKISSIYYIAAISHNPFVVTYISFPNVIGAKTVVTSKEYVY